MSFPVTANTSGSSDYKDHYHKYQDIMSWESSILVSVSYQKGDYLGLFYAYFGLLVYCIPLVYLTLMFRDRHLLTWLCCGSHFVHELTTKYIKKMLGEPRPSNGPPSNGLFDGPYGMPSQHVSCTSYLTVMTSLLLFYHYKGFGSFKIKLMSTLILLVGLWLQCLARLHLRYHDNRQVMGGLAHGCISSLIHFTIIEMNMPLVSRICRWPIFSHLGFEPDFLSVQRLDKIHFN